MSPNTVFVEFVESVGGPTKAAHLLEVTYGMVDHILKGRRGVSKRIAEKVDAVSGGKFSKSDLMFGRSADIRGAVRTGDVRDDSRPQRNRNRVQAA